MNLAFQINLMQKIELQPEVSEQVLRAFQTHKRQIAWIIKRASLKNCMPFYLVLKLNRKKGALICLAAALAIAERTYAQYKKMGIPDEIFYDTMRDIALWTENAKREKKVCGLLEIAWIRHALFMNLFKIGRLQYQFYKTDYLRSGLSPEHIKAAPFPDHTAVLNIHIPQGEKLKLTACRESVARAREFFGKFYPEYAYRGFVCDSWLLDPRNSAFMKPGSNILQFSDLFSGIVPVRFNNREIMRRLWSAETADLSAVANLPEQTDLQKRTKQYLLSGGKTGNGFGFIEK